MIDETGLRLLGGWAPSGFRSAVSPRTPSGDEKRSPPGTPRPSIEINGWLSIGWWTNSLYRKWLEIIKHPFVNGWPWGSRHLHSKLGWFSFRTRTIPLSVLRGDRRTIEVLAKVQILCPKWLDWGSGAEKNATSKERTPTGGWCWSDPPKKEQPFIVHESSFLRIFCVFFFCGGVGGKSPFFNFLKMNSEKTLVVV